MWSVLESRIKPRGLPCFFYSSIGILPSAWRSRAASDPIQLNRYCSFACPPGALAGALRSTSAAMLSISAKLGDSLAAIAKLEDSLAAITRTRKQGLPALTTCWTRLKKNPENSSHINNARLPCGTGAFFTKLANTRVWQTRRGRQSGPFPGVPIFRRGGTGGVVNSFRVVVTG